MQGLESKFDGTCQLGGVPPLHKSHLSRNCQKQSGEQHRTAAVMFCSVGCMTYC